MFGNLTKKLASKHGYPKMPSAQKQVAKRASLRIILVPAAKEGEAIIWEVWRGPYREDSGAQPTVDLAYHAARFAVSVHGTPEEINSLGQQKIILDPPPNPEVEHTTVEAVQ